jgi:predicted nucleic acid-binding protein
MGNDLIIKDITRHSFSPEDEIVFDTNVYMSLFGPYCYTEPGYFAYSSALKEIRKNNVGIILSTIIISEFINTFSHKIWENLSDKSRYPHFKDFRNSPDFIKVSDEIGLWIDEFLDMVSCCRSEFDDDKAQEYLDKYLSGTLDFNDIIISDFCKSNGKVLVTHDFDFINCNGITVLTANKRLIRTKT